MPPQEAACIHEYRKLKSVSRQPSLNYEHELPFQRRVCTNYEAAWAAISVDEGTLVK